MFTKKFWKDAIERTVRTFAQTVLATGLLSQPLGLDWKAVLLAAGGTAATSLLSAIAYPAKSTSPVIATVPAIVPTVSTVAPTVNPHEG